MTLGEAVSLIIVIAALVAAAFAIGYAMRRH